VTKGRNVTSNSRVTGYPIMWLVSGDQGNGSLTMSDTSIHSSRTGSRLSLTNFDGAGPGVYLKLTQAVRAA
jgi:hypothetical protein